MSGLAKFLPDLEKVSSHKGDVEVKSLAGKTVFFYFSASWCPPCRAFTPQLIDFYNKTHDEKNFEVILVSWDEEEEDYNGYFGKMPWLALPFSKKTIQEGLSKEFNVEAIPTLIGVNADSGDVITTNARFALVKDPEGAEFPWPASK